MQWLTKTTYVDLETGNILTPTQAKTAYIVIKTIKEVNTKQNEHTIQREYTKLCRRKPKQLKIW